MTAEEEKEVLVAESSANLNINDGTCWHIGGSASPKCSVVKQLNSSLICFVIDSLVSHTN